MKITFVIDQIYKHGGIERILSVKANYLASLQGYQVCIVTTQQKGNKPCYDFNNNIHFEDLGINYFKQISYFHPKNLVKLPKHFFRLSKLFKRMKPDVVVVCSHSTDTYFIPFINTSIPKIKEFHYSKFIEVDPRKKAKGFFKKWFFKFSDFVESKYQRVIVLNKDESKYYKCSNTIVIPNPITFDSDKASLQKNKIAVAIGRIAPVKGYDTLIDIWSYVSKEYPDWQLHIYGDGEAAYINYLKDKINNSNLENVIILKGNTNNVEQILLSASIFCMTSLNECFPLVLLEAQTCGLPIIAFDCPHGPRNIITNNETGVLVAERNKDAFVSKINCLIDNEDIRIKMGKLARQNVKKYDIDVIMKKWVDLFTQIT